MMKPTATTLEALVEETDETELAAAHAGMWGSENEDESAFVFRLRAYRSPVVDDPRRIVDFPRLAVLDIWTHADPPISRMNARELSDLVFGLEWLLTSDVYASRGVRDADIEAWFVEFRSAAELARRRAYWIAEHASAREILNVERYAERAVMEGGGAENPEHDYDSDDEARMRKKTKLAKHVLDWIEAEWRASDAFVKDMNGALGAMDDALFTMWYVRRAFSVREADWCDLTPLRSRVLRELTGIKPESAMQHRREWVQNLMVTSNMRATHCRVHLHDRRPTSRSVLVKKHESLAFVCVPASLEDMLVPPPVSDGRRGAVDIRINGDAALFYSSASVSRGDFVRDMWLGNVDWRSIPAPRGSEPRIGRLVAEQKYALFVGAECWRADSFAAAFAFYRVRFGVPNDARSRYDGEILLRT